MRTLPTIFDATPYGERICLGADPPLPVRSLDNDVQNISPHKAAHHAS